MNELEVEIRELVTGYRGGDLDRTCRELVRENSGEQFQVRRSDDLAVLKAWLHHTIGFTPGRATNAKAVAQIVRESLREAELIPLPVAA